jgi:hypothetical protein
MPSKLFVLISTIDDRVVNVQNILQLQETDIIYIVSHQLTKELSFASEQFVVELQERVDVIYRTLNQKGVAKNRNNTLQYIEPNSICLILDDDVTLCENIYKNVINAFNDNPSIDFISFKILDEKHQDYKAYPLMEKAHTWKSLTNIGTTEMAFRSDVILTGSFSFDERFGPGIEVYPSGEDYIFAMDLYHEGVKMYFVPINIVSHPKESTGYVWNSKGFFAKGAVFSRVFGWKSYLIDFYFVFKHHKEYRNEYSFFSALNWMWKGSHHFLQGDQL